MKASWNFILDSILLVAFLTVLWTAGLLRFVFPSAAEAAGYRLWGMGYAAWVDVHLLLIAIFGVAVLVHVIFHWRWIAGFVATRWNRRRGTRVPLNDAVITMYGVAMLIGLLAILGGLTLAASIAMERGL